MKKNNWLVVLFICFALLSCDMLGVHDNETDHPKADIVFGKSVKNIQLGDHIKDIKSRYDLSKAKTWSTDGIVRVWDRYTFTSGELTGVSFDVLTRNTEGDESEETKNKGIVDYIMLTYPVHEGSDSPIYTGTTEDGIGLGSNIESVEKGLGKPDHIRKLNLNDVKDGKVWQYCIEHEGQNIEAELTFYADTVVTMDFGYYVPYEDTTLVNCSWRK